MKLCHTFGTVKWKWLGVVLLLVVKVCDEQHTERRWDLCQGEAQNFPTETPMVLRLQGETKSVAAVHRGRFEKTWA